MKEDIIGERFGRLLVIEVDASVKNKTFYMCLCDCGNVKSVYRDHLKTGATSSCGCFRSEKFSSMLTKHGMSNTKIYKIWAGMIERCSYKRHKSYKYYGGRGISVCEEWLNSFENFYNWSIENGYREGLTIDRVDNDGNYCPENCKWVTMEDQSKNKSNTVFIEIDGVKKTLSEWSDFLNIKLSTLRDRYYRRKTFPPRDKK